MMTGIGLTLLSYFLFSFHDAAIKWLVAGLSVWQILFFRSVMIIAACLVFGRGPLISRAVATPIKWMLILRGGVLLTAWLCYFTAARDLQLAELTTIYFAAPILIIVLAIPLLGERVNGWRWAAVIVGFVGVLIACNPVGLGLSLPVGLALIAAGLWALSIVLIRMIALRESALLQMIYANGVFLIATGSGLWFFWQAPSWPETGLMVLIGLLGGMGQFLLFEGMRRAPASVLAPFEYTALIWAVVLGFVIWGDVPRPEVLAGAGLILAAGLMVIAAGRRDTGAPDGA